MSHSSDRILTTHVGSLPRPDALIEANRRAKPARLTDEAGFQQSLTRRSAMSCGTAASSASTFRTTASSANRVATGSITALGGVMPFSPAGAGSNSARPAPMGARRSARSPGEIVLTSQDDRRDRQRFAAAYADPESGVSMGPRPTTGPVCVAR